MKYESLLCCCTEVSALEENLFLNTVVLGHLDYKGGKGGSDDPGI